MTNSTPPAAESAARPRPVRLTDVSAALPGAVLHPAPGAAPGTDPELHDVTLDSRCAGSGTLFACRPGANSDGHDHAPEAVAAGAVALLVERPLPVRVAQLQVPSVADSVGHAAAVVHGQPSQELLLAGVTGTNGKTTSAYLMEAALRAAGHRTGLIGTVQTLIDGVEQEGVRTTPESTDLQRLFRQMRTAQVTAAAMEVSSHGLALGRLRGTRFAAAVFTNLTQDHLDFHRDLEDYFAAKASLFHPSYTDRAIINIDDEYGRRLVDLAAAQGLYVTTTSARGADADVRAEQVTLRADGSEFTVTLDEHSLRVALHLPGGFNVANALGALAAVAAMGIDVNDAVRGISALPGVPGRMERVECGQPFTVLVDYAHTPDSVEHVLRAARELTGGQVIVVLGCGGDRDKSKREPMGKAAASLADLSVFTSDNPRSEDPATILEAMARGAAGTGGTWIIEPSRYAAIGMAFDAAGPGDVVVIAGKGHEATQEFAQMTVPFDDRQVAAELLAVQAGGSAP